MAKKANGNGNNGVEFSATEKPVISRARPGRNGHGMITPFQPGDRHQTGYRKPSVYIETLHLARKSSPDAMRTLIERLHDPDGRIAVMAANLILERAWGKVREQKAEEKAQQKIDLSKLTGPELALLLQLAESGRLGPAEDDKPTIEGEKV
jgi:hypothetical protein